MTGAIRDTFTRFARAMEAGGFPYAVVGAFAVSAWGAPRTTQDVDAVIAVEVEGVQVLVDVLQRHGLRLQPEDMRDVLSEGSHAPVFDEDSIYHVDLKPATDEPSRRTLAGARRVVLDGVQVALASPEDAIAHKLLSGSEQDQRDAESILARQGPRLDAARLDALATALHVKDALQALRARVRE